MFELRKTGTLEGIELQLTHSWHHQLMEALLHLWMCVYSLLCGFVCVCLFSTICSLFYCWLFGWIISDKPGAGGRGCSSAKGSVSADSTHFNTHKVLNLCEPDQSELSFAQRITCTDRRTSDWCCFEMKLRLLQTPWTRREQSSEVCLIQCNGECTDL